MAAVGTNKRLEELTEAFFKKDSVGGTVNN